MRPILLILVLFVASCEYDDSAIFTGHSKTDSNTVFDFRDEITGTYSGTRTDCTYTYINGGGTSSTTYNYNFTITKDSVPYKIKVDYLVIPIDSNYHYYTSGVSFDRTGINNVMYTFNYGGQGGGVKATVRGTRQ